MVSYGILRFSKWLDYLLERQRLKIAEITIDPNDHVAKFDSEESI